MESHVREPRPSQPQQTGLRRIATNALSILASDATTRIANFVVYALVARFLGAFEFGQLALGLTLFRTFQLLAVAGLKALVTREVARNSENAGRYFVNASIIVLLSSLAAIAALKLFTVGMDYTPDTAHLIVFLSLGLIPYSLSLICDALFQAREQMHYITISNVIVNLTKIAAAFWILSQGYGLNQLIIVFLFCFSLGLVVKWGLLVRQLKGVEHRLDPRFCLEMAKSTVTFLGINGLNAVLTSLNIVLLSRFTSEVEVGLYSAAAQLLIPVALVFESIGVGVYPVMCRSFKKNSKKLQRILERLTEFVFAIVLPASVALYFFSETLLLLFYGDRDFSRAAEVLRIVVWGLIFRSLAKAFGLTLVASLREKATLRILFFDVLTTAIVGPILIGQFGLIGSAVTLLTVRFVDFVQHYVPVAHMFKTLALRRLLWKPVIPAACIALYLFTMQEQNFYLNIAAAATLYVATLFILSAWSAGGVKQLKERYFLLWTS